MEKQTALEAPRTARQRFWLKHLEACREQGISLKAYARTHDLSLTALYAAKAALKRHATPARSFWGSTAPDADSLPTATRTKR